MRTSPLLQVGADGAEQRMIESLGEHGVDPADLVPALMTTHTVKNPEYDPAAKKRADMEAALGVVREEDEEDEAEAPPPYEARGAATQADPSSPAHEQPTPYPPISDLSAPPAAPTEPSQPTRTEHRASNPFGSDDESDNPIPSSSRTAPLRPTTHRVPSYEEEEGDLGAALSPTPEAMEEASKPSATDPVHRTMPNANPPSEPDNPDPGEDAAVGAATNETDSVNTSESQAPIPQAEPLPEDEKLPSLPGVSTKLSTTDEMVTLDIRWTVVSLTRSGRKASLTSVAV